MLKMYHHITTTSKNKGKLSPKIYFKPAPTLKTKEKLKAPFIPHACSTNLPIHHYSTKVNIKASL